jgi:hypothetical protein
MVRVHSRLPPSTAGKSLFRMGLPAFSLVADGSGKQCVRPRQNRRRYAHFLRNRRRVRRVAREAASTEPELIVGFYRRDSGYPSMTWPESVDEALCVGWIDGVRTRIDEVSYKIRFTPRKTTSTWSAINIERVRVLQAAGRMRKAGLEAAPSAPRREVPAWPSSSRPRTTVDASEETKHGPKLRRMQSGVRRHQAAARRR